MQTKEIVKAGLRVAGYPFAYAAGWAPTARRPTAQLALVSDGAEYTSEEQFAPLLSNRQELRKRLGLNVMRVALSDALLAPTLLLAPFDLIFLKLSFRTKPADVMRIVTTIRSAIHDRKLVYFDGDDDQCVQWPQILPFLDLYVKKHMFSSCDQYSKIFVGKSNLTDYVHRNFGVSFADDPIAQESTPVPSGELGKLVVGWNLALDQKMVQLHKELSKRPAAPAKSNDIVCRAGMPRDWIYHLRKDIAPALARMQQKFRVIAPTQRVTPDVYLTEMLSSRICISPFGYGEICWRDIEAILCGCMLIKPDMGHLETHPIVFRPSETYVPVRWDFSDLEDKCDHYLSHPEELDRITTAAKEELERFYNGDGFNERVRMILSRLELAC